MNFIINNIGTIIVALIVIAVVVAVVHCLLKARQKGRNCCAGCANCPKYNQCGNEQKKSYTR